MKLKQLRGVLMGIRNACKAIIVNDGKILINKNINTLGEMCYGLPNGAVYYDLPGGGQNRYETLEEAAIRECLEETGITVEVERLAAIYEEISLDVKFRQLYEEYAHKVHFVFICRPSGTVVMPATVKDMDMECSEWVDIARIGEMPLYPKTVNKNLSLLLKSEMPLYLGSEYV